MTAAAITQLDARGTDLFRLNLSHVSVEDVERMVRFVRRHTDKPPCLDTDGAHVRCGRMKSNTALSVDRRYDSRLGFSGAAPLEMLCRHVLGRRKVLRELVASCRNEFRSELVISARS